MQEIQLERTKALMEGYPTGRTSHRSTVISVKATVPQKQLQLPVFEEIRPKHVQFNTLRSEYFYKLSSEDTFCFDVNLNVTKTLYKLMCQQRFYTIFMIVYVLFSQIVRIYLMASLWHIITFKIPTAEIVFFVLAIAISRILYFLAVLRAGLIKSKQGSFELIIKSFMRGKVQTWEEDIFFKVGKQDIILALKMAIFPAQFSFLIMPSNDRQQKKRIYLLLNFIQESLDLVFFLPLYVGLYIVFEDSKSFGLDRVLEAVNLYIAMFQFTRMMCFNMFLIIKSAMIKAN